MERSAMLAQLKRVVVKIGTSVLSDSSGAFSLAALKHVVREIHHLHEAGREVVLVSSGAIGCGMKTLGLKRRPKKLEALQACAAIGQGKLMKAYEDFFSGLGRHAAQVLLTRDAFQDRARCFNIRNTLGELLRLRAIPIINENDTVSTEEICFGDNDTLSVFVAELIEADLLVLLSDVDGLYACEKSKSVIRHVATPAAVDELFQHVFTKRSDALTVGGMRTKLEASKRAMRNGISAVVLNGKLEDSLSRFMKGEPLGTFFAGSKARRGFKKRWLSDLTQAHGILCVDEGARKALLEGGKSLLPSGVREVRGDFKEGDSVRIASEDGSVFGRGIVNYAKEELIKIKGKKTSDIAAVLGYKREDEIIHRDNLVVTE